MLPANASKVACLLLACFVLNACGLGSTTRTWTEAVRLSDGRVVTVERRERSRSGGALGGPVDVQRESTELRMTLSPGNELPVLKIGDGKVSEVPIIMDVTGAPSPQYFAVTIVDHDDQVTDPALSVSKPYYEYLLIDGTWKRRPISEQRMGHRANLLLDMSLLKTTDSISLGAKEAADRSARIAARYQCVRYRVDNGPCQ